MGIFKYFKKDKTEIIESKDVITFIDNALIEEINPYDQTAKKSTAPGMYEYREPEMFGFNLNDWKESVSDAWSESNPNRIELSDIYKAITNYDAQTIAGINQRKLFTLQGDIKLYNEDGTVNDDATKLIKTPSGSTIKWFRDFMSYSLDSIFWGFELVVLDVVDGKIKINKVPERNLVPSRNSILKDSRYAYSTNNAIDYTKAPFDLITCKISYTNDVNDLGLLSGIAPYFFSKCTGNWKAHADKFGMLTRVLTTNSENKNKMTGAFNSLKNQVRGNFVVLGQGDTLSFEGDTRTNISIYKDLNEYCDANISKIILGQTGTTDEKSYSGSANIHKQVLDSIIRSDREFIESVVNDQLIPKLQKLGLLPENIYFGISENVEQDLIEMSTIVKNLTESGFKPSNSWVEEVFDIELDKIQPTQLPTQNNTK